MPRQHRVFLFRGKGGLHVVGTLRHAVQQEAGVGPDVVADLSRSASRLQRKRGREVQLRACLARSSSLQEADGWDSVQPWAHRP
jgi:hypothetical protein